jgi:cell division inhibitor SepF
MNIFHRVWDSLGLSDRYDDEYAYEYEEEASPDLYAPEGAYPMDRQPIAMNNVVGLPNRRVTQEIMVMEPHSFEEIPQAVAALRDRKSVILNLTLMDPDVAQRCVDFVAGGAFAIDGHQERLGENIFLFTPNYVQINSQSPIKPQAVQPPVAAPSPSPRVAPPAPTITWPTEQSHFVP